MALSILWMICGRLPLHIRAAKLIAGMMQSGDQSAVVHCTQNELAYTLGVTRVSIAHALKRLATLNLVRLEYRKIVVADPDALNAWISEQTV